jgi:hypothetical protein
MFISTGLHTCFHAYPKSASKRLSKTSSTISVSDHEDDVYKLMRGIDNRLKTSGAKKITVIFVTEGRLYNLFPTDSSMQNVVDQCIWKFNRLVARAAHEFGFVVLEVITL